MISVAVLRVVIRHIRIPCHWNAYSKPGGGGGDGGGGGKPML